MPPTTDSMPCARVDLDGVAVAYWATGDGVPVVCLHAAGHGAADFAALPDRIGGHLRWVALDWPGHGASGRDRVPASAGRYADLLERFLDASGIEAAVLLGNSIGGAAAIRVAATHPERVRGLVLADPGGLAAIDAATRVVCRLMVAFFRAGARRARWFGPAFALYYRLVLPGAPARAHRRRIVAGAYDAAPALAEAWASFARPEADLRPLLPQLACPVLFTWARGDRIVSLGRSRAAVATLPDARLERCRGGHAAFLEDPETFDAAFRAFVADLADADAGAAGGAGAPPLTAVPRRTPRSAGAPR